MRTAIMVPENAFITLLWAEGAVCTHSVNAAISARRSYFAQPNEALRRP